MTHTPHHDNSREAREADARGITKDQLLSLKIENEQSPHRSATEVARFRDAVGSAFILSEDEAERILPDVKAAMIEHEGRAKAAAAIQKS